MAARIERGRPRLLTRTGLDWSDKYPTVVAALAKVQAKAAYLDGELCGVGDDGFLVCVLPPVPRCSDWVSSSLISPSRISLPRNCKYPTVVAALAKVQAKAAYLDGELCGVGDDGFLVCVLPPVPRCSDWVSSFSLISPSRISLPRNCSRVGLHIVLFEACSAFTRVAARTLARSPIRDPLYRRLQPFRHLHDYSGCFRLERSPGGTCTHWKAPPSHGARKSRSSQLGAPTPAKSTPGASLRSPLRASGKREKAFVIWERGRARNGHSLKAL